MASNNENCRKCLKTIKGDSICCSTCNKWYHFKCSNLKKEVFKQHTKNDKLIWDCDVFYLNVVNVIKSLNQIKTAQNVTAVKNGYI